MTTPEPHYRDEFDTALAGVDADLTKLGDSDPDIRAMAGAMRLSALASMAVADRLDKVLNALTDLVEQVAELPGEFGDVATARARNEFR